MGRVLTIGLHMHEGWELTRRLIDGVLEYAGEHGLAIRDFTFPADSFDLPEFPPWLGKADGMVTHLTREPGLLPWLQRGRVPVVNADGDLNQNVVSVYTDPQSICELGVAHLLEAGVRNFAYIGYRHSDSSRDRYRLLADVLSRQQLSLKGYQTEQKFNGTSADLAPLQGLEPKLVDLIRRAKKPLGVLALGDRWAAVVCRIARELDFSIPQDVAVLGVNDLDVARLAAPPISSIRTPGERIGYEAARLVHRMIRGKRLARRIVKLPALELVPRESTIGKQRAPKTDLDRALTFIQEKTCEGIRIEHVAAHVHVPLRTFELQFAKRIGHTVGEAMRRVRIERVKTLLETTDLPLSTVAYQVGMNDTSCLSGFFRRWMHTTPAAYRREHRKTSVA